MGERQQINLYQPAADLSKRPFSARTATLSVGAVLLALLGIWGYGSWQVSQLQKAVTALEQQQRHQEDAVSAAGAIHAARAKPEQLQAQIKELTAQVALRRRALDLLRAGAEGRTHGFSAPLAGLARRHVEGLWIDHIVLSASAGAMTLEGAALDPDLVPRYLHDLAQDPALAGARFDELVIERHAAAHSADAPVTPANLLRFRAASGSPAPVQHAGAAT